VAAAQRWFPERQFWTAWADVPKLLLDRLRALDSGLSVLAPLLDEHVPVDPVENLEIYLRLADLLERVRERDDKNVLMERFWDALPRLTSSREWLESLVFDPRWRCLRLAAIADVDKLLELADGFRQDESFCRLYEELDTRMRQDEQTTTRALARKEWWYFWRCQSRLTDAAILQASAFHSFAAEEATLEAWKQALADLPPRISGEAFARLRNGNGRSGRPWPWIPPFEEEQL